MTADGIGPAEPERRGAVLVWLIAVLAIGAVLVPLFLTPVVPAVDFYAHVVRYFALAHIDVAPNVAENYDAAWKILPNLGLDLLATALMEVVPPLFATKLIAALMILSVPAGMAALSWVLNGRVTAMALVGGLILSYSHILIWGFANFLIGLGLALAGIALWIALADRPARQLAFALPFALVLFFVHGLAFAFWGLLLGTVELVLAWERGQVRPLALAVRMARLASLAVLPVLLFLQMPTSGAEGGVTPAFANLQTAAGQGRFWPEVIDEALSRVDVTLRVADSGHPWIDRTLGVAMWGLLAWGFVRGGLRLDRRIWLAAGLAACLVLVMPPFMFSVGYLNDRAPLVLAALLFAGAVPYAPSGKNIFRALAGIAVLRLCLVGATWAESGAMYRGYIAALAVHETGNLGLSVYLDDTDRRDPGIPRCEPLAPLMLLLNGTAVRTFAINTQQPITLAGPLADLADRSGPLLQNIPSQAEHETLDALAALGPSAMVVCAQDGRSLPSPEAFELAAQSFPWALYTRAE